MAPPAEPLLRRIAVTTHGRYLVAPPPDGPAPILLGFHGYGENAERALRDLSSVPGAGGWLRCAVQGLHRFYHAKSGEVLASWMTREDRELAIADNVAYTRAVVAAVREEFATRPPAVYLGFSQGVAMAYRAAMGSADGAAGVVALAGDVPPELHGEDLRRLGRVLVARGTGDDWYTAAKMEADLELLRARGVPCDELTFAGGHEWTDEFRAAAGRLLAVARAE